MPRIHGHWDLFETIDQPDSVPGRPEIVVIGGFLGLHLARPDGFRIWLTPLAFSACDVATELTLEGPRSLRPDGLNEIIYTDLVYDLRRAGYVVHAFAFDFRRSVLDIAKDLAEALAALGPNKRFVFVAHSMGALVAARYPEADPAFKTRVERVILLGGTLSGTFEVIDAARGAHPIIGRLANFSAENDPKEYAACMRSWPGLYDMLPDPAKFQGGERAFQFSAWDDGKKPVEALLRRAWETREAVNRSAIFEVPVAQLLSVRFSTADAYDDHAIAVGSRSAAGDGTVAARTAMLPGVTVYRVELPHTLIPLEPAAIRAVIDLVRTGQCDLPLVTEEEANARIEGTEPTLDDIVREYLFTTFAHPERLVRLLEIALWLGPASW